MLFPEKSNVPSFLKNSFKNPYQHHHSRILFMTFPQILLK